jgi:glycerol-3-phosphate dehydrogenase (NAD(P)+)
MRDTVAVLGAGSWGTTLSKLLAGNGNGVRLHCYPADIAAGIRETRRNPLYFPDVELPAGVEPCTDLAAALDGVGVAYLVIPTRYLRSFFAEHQAALSGWDAAGHVLCNCTKGLLLDPTQRTDEWLRQMLPAVQLVHLAGPNLAAELMAGHPAAAVAAGDAVAARAVQDQLMSGQYRVYTGPDTVGVEVAGFYKNIIAIAAGAVDTLGLGDNTKSVLITRGLAEMGRLVAYFGGDERTLSGLAGIGDLVTTCAGRKSRNFQVGMRRAQGQPLSQILEEMTQVAEGITAVQAVKQWPAEHGLTGWPELPIADEVFRFVHEGCEPGESISRLMLRPPKAE